MSMRLSELFLWVSGIDIILMSYWVYSGCLFCGAALNARWLSHSHTIKPLNHSDSRCMASCVFGHPDPVSHSKGRLWLFDCLGPSFPWFLCWSLNPLATLYQNLHSETCIQALSETRKGDSGGEFWAESMSQLLQLGLHLPETFLKNPYIRPFLNLFSNLL